MADVTAATQEAEEDEEEEEDDDDDVVDELPPPPANRGQRQSVSAEAYGAWNQKAAFVAPVYEKTQEQMARIAQILAPSFLFSALEPQEMQTVSMAFMEKIAQPGERIIQQGDDGESMFLIEEGAVDCIIQFSDGLERIVKQCGPGEVVGELALLYNTTRAASVQATFPTTFWELDRDTFNRIVKDAASNKREIYMQYLQRVPLFSNMESHEMMTIVDAWKVATYPDVHSLIIQQGDLGDKFFIIAEGQCEAWKVLAEGEQPQKVHTHEAGDYFGELALLQSDQHPRAASVVTSWHNTKLLWMDRKTFKRLIGPVESILQRQVQRYG